MEIMTIKGGGSRTLNGKFHFKFPFCFADNPPNSINEDKSREGGGGDDILERVGNDAEDI